MLGDVCTCDLGWALLTPLLDRDAPHTSLQGTCRGHSPLGCWSQVQTPVSRNVTSASSIGLFCQSPSLGAHLSLTPTHRMPILPLGLACVWSLSLWNPVTWNTVWTSGSGNLSLSLGCEQCFCPFGVSTSFLHFPGFFVGHRKSQLFPV